MDLLGWVWVAAGLRAWQLELLAGMATAVVAGRYIWRGFARWVEERREGEPTASGPLTADDVDAVRWTTKQLSAAPLYPPKDTD